MRAWWWGEFEIPQGQGRQWRIGPCHLQVHRTEYELRVVLWRDEDAHDPTFDMDVPVDEEPPASAILGRFGFQRSPDRISLLPVPADRPVIARPEHPFYLPPHERAVIYVSSPLWVQLHAGNSGAMLFEQPLYRPSDTWFGDSTRSGELAYASRTTARLDLENIPILSHRAISAVELENRADTVLELDRLRLPAPNLSLHATAGGHLWTESVFLVREEDGDVAAIRTEDQPPAELGPMQFVRAPRVKSERGTLLRSFGRALRGDF